MKENKTLLDYYHDKTMYKLALKMVKDNQKAHDLVQDTVIRILEKQHLYADAGKPVAFIKVMMKRIHLNQVRKHNVHMNHIDDYVEDSYIDDTAFNRMYIDQILSKAKYRDLLYLRMQGFKAHEIGRILDLNINTVFSRDRFMNIGLNELK